MPGVLVLVLGKARKAEQAQRRVAGRVRQNNGSHRGDELVTKEARERGSTAALCGRRVELFP